MIGFPLQVACCKVNCFNGLYKVLLLVISGESTCFYIFEALFLCLQITHIGTVKDIRGS